MTVLFAAVESAREEIADIQEETPSLTREVIEAMWDKCFKAAKRDADLARTEEKKTDAAGKNEKKGSASVTEEQEAAHA